MTRKKKLTFGFAVALLVVAQMSWVALSLSSGPALGVGRVLLGITPLLAIDALLAACVFLLLKTSLGRKRFAIAALIVFAPLVARFVVGRHFDTKRAEALANVHARIAAEHARLAKVPRPAVGSAKDDDAAPLYKGLTAPPADELAAIWNDFAPAATDGPPVRLRAARALDAKLALVQALHDAASCMRCDPGAVVAIEHQLLPHTRGMLSLIDLVLTEGHRYRDRKEPAKAATCYLVALRIASDLTSARTEDLVARGCELEAHALKPLLALVTSGELSRDELAAVARDLERLEPAIYSPANTGELEKLRVLGWYS